jgi:hypothetical protein
LDESGLRAQSLTMRAPIGSLSVSAKPVIGVRP